MTTELKPHRLPNAKSRKNRAAWRQRLVDAERGFSQGLRSDSTFFVHFFVGTVIVAAGFVLGISLLQWTVVVLALTLVLSAEMFNQVLQAIWKTVGHHLSQEGVNAVRMGTAAVFVTLLGAAVTIVLIFGQRLSQLLAD